MRTFFRGVGDQFDAHDLLFKLSNQNMWRAFDTSFKPPYPMDIWLNSEYLCIEIPILQSELTDVKITTTSDELTVTRSAPKIPEDRVYVNQGIVKRPFSYTWRPGPKFDLEKLSAEYNNGLLTISIPIATSAMPREVSILNHGENWKKIATGQSLESEQPKKSGKVPVLREDL